MNQIHKQYITFWSDRAFRCDPKKSVLKKKFFAQTSFGRSGIASPAGVFRGARISSLLRASQTPAWKPTPECWGHFGMSHTSLFTGRCWRYTRSAESLACGGKFLFADQFELVEI